MKMEGRRPRRHLTTRPARPSYTSSPSSSEEQQEIAIKKGPWKAEEDEVLLKHVSKYGPRDWSSLLSKGHLRRTGKSCRLRWVNKLRPNLKNGCKFSAEEERVVIELQAQLGNKWAKISTYLNGRTDNDVKNFWSSRQKRLARLLHNSQSSKSNFTSLTKGSDAVVVESSSKAESSSSIDYNALEMNFMNELPPITSSFELIPVDLQKKELPFIEPSSDQQFIGSLDLDFMGAFPRLNDPISGPIADDERLTMQQPLAGTSFSDQNLDGPPNDLLFYHNSLSPDTFFGDLPSDIFDQMERIPSPP